MRTDSYIVSKPLLNGISPTVNGDPSTFLADAVDVLFTPNGVADYVHPASIKTSVYDGTFDYQLLQGFTSLFQVVPERGIITMRSNTGLDTKEVVKISPHECNGNWSIASFGDLHYLTNGTKTVRVRNEQDFDVSVSNVAFNAIAFHEGRIVMSGFRLTNRLRRYFDKHNDSVAIPFTTPYQRGDYIMWTTPGSADMIDMLAFDDSVSDQDITELFKINMLGYMQIPNIGEVIDIVPYLGYLVIFGTSHTAILYNADGANFAIDLPRSYGVKNVFNFSLYNAGACAVSAGKLYCVDRAGNLRMLEDSGFSIVGYQYLIARENPRKIKLFDSPQNNALLISTDNTTYILPDKGGLSRLSTHITAATAALTIQDKTEQTDKQVTTLPLITALQGGRGTLTGLSWNTETGNTQIQISSNENNIVLHLVDYGRHIVNVKLKCVSFNCTIKFDGVAPSALTIFIQQDDKSNVRTRNQIDFGQ